ncbi:hypothetical protein CRUP_007662 [Coryphaenoides rupestris]|nr:hypothetical protein CRUP_007662 [Coryphaenoides rupestris]
MVGMVGMVVVDVGHNGAADMCSWFPADPSPGTRRTAAVPRLEEDVFRLDGTVYVGVHVPMGQERRRRHRHRGNKHHKKRRERSSEREDGRESPKHDTPSQRVQFILGMDDDDEEHIPHDWDRRVWLKFEEDVEDGGERWSKPYVATLSLHSLFELRSCIMNGTVAAGHEGQHHRGDRSLEAGLEDKNEKKLSNRIPLVRSFADIGKKQSDPHLLERNGTGLLASPQSAPGNLDKSKTLEGRGTPGGGGVGGGSTENSTVDFSKVDMNFMKKIPHGAEASNVLVGQVDFLDRPIMSLRPAVPRRAADWPHRGPCPHKIFHDVAYKAKDRADLLSGIDEFLDQCLASVLFLYCACMSPVITFGGLLGEATKGNIPLTILGSTGPVLVFEKILFKFCRPGQPINTGLGHRTVYVGVHVPMGQERRRRHRHRGNKHHKKRRERSSEREDGRESPNYDTPSQRVQFILGMDDDDEEHIPHDLWLKFEEDVEDGGERWSKPYVATLSLHSLFELRSCIMNGTVLLDMRANTIEEIADMLIDSMLASGQLEAGLEDKVKEAMLKRHHHQNEKKLSNRIPLVRSFADIGKKQSDPHLLERNGTGLLASPQSAPGNLDQSKTLEGRGTPGGGGVGGGSTENSTVDFSKVDMNFMKKIPHGAEASNVLVGQVDFLDRPIIAFVRLSPAVLLTGLTEIFHDVAYKAKDRADLLSGIDEFLDQCLASVLFLYCACMSPSSPSAASGLSPSWAALVRSWVFEKILFKFCSDYDLCYLSLRTSIGLWTAILCLVLVATDASSLVCYITRFTEEAFAALICIIFIYEALEKLVHLGEQYPVNMHSHPDNATFHTCQCSPPVNTTPLQVWNSSGLSIDAPSWSSLDVQACRRLGGTLSCRYVPDVLFWSVILFFTTFFLSSFFKQFKTKRYFPTKVRSTISDFAVFLTIMIMVLVDYLVGIPSPKLEVPERFQSRGWLISPLGPNPWWTLLAAVIPALLCTILIFMDQQITAVIINRKENKLKKGCGYHLDLLVVAVMLGVCSVMGLPWFVAATVLSISHVNSLKLETQCAAPGEQPRFLGVREQRITGLLIFLLMGCSVFMTSVLKLFDRIKLFGMPAKHQPDLIYLRYVPLWKVHVFTLVQLTCLTLLWVIKASAAAVVFPMMVLALVFIRKLLDFCFTKRELSWLDDLIPESKKKREDDKKKREKEEVKKMLQSSEELTTKSLKGGTDPSMVNISDEMSKTSLWKALSFKSENCKNLKPSPSPELQPGVQIIVEDEEGVKVVNSVETSM